MKLSNQGCSTIRWSNRRIVFFCPNRKTEVPVKGDTFMAAMLIDLLKSSVLVCGKVY